MTVLARILLVACALGTALPGPADAGASRVVSINLCTDQLTVLLADRETILSVSILADDPNLSYVADRVDGLPRNNGMAEEILALSPDLVLAGPFRQNTVLAILRARGVPVLELGLAEDFTTIAEQTRTVARALGVPERGEALIERMNATLAAAKPAAETGSGRPAAAIYQANGFTAGAGTLPDTVLKAAGFENVAARAGIVGYGYLTIEQLLTAAPDLLIAEHPQDGPPSLAHELLRHPAIRRIGSAMAMAAVPRGTLACGGPFTAEAVAALAEWRLKLEREAP